MSSKKCVGYWGTWANYRPGDGKFDYTNINPSIFTHLIYAFFGITVDGDITILDEWLDIELGFIEKFIALKSINPACKMLASVGGWNCSETIFSQMASTSQTRSAFAKNTLDFLKKYGFDGMDIDWEYPVTRDSAVHPEDKNNFVLLLQEIKNLLRPEGLLLTIAVGATSSKGDVSYDIPGIVPNVDFINLMTYDLHGAWDSKTGINSPLYAGSDSSQMLNVDSCVKYWLEKGCPKDKLIVGIPTYGRSFTLQDPSNNGINAPSSGPGDAGEWSRQSGLLGYNEILLKGWTKHWQDDQKVPYAFDGNQWVGYDDEKSVAGKANYVKDNDLGGCMFWSIETDDFRHNSPLISTAFNIMNQSQAKILCRRDPILNCSYDNAKTNVTSYQRNPIMKFQHSIQSVVTSHSRKFGFFLFTIMALMFFYALYTLLS